jgi:MtN3 and saliva related transmembrane protein
VESTLALIAASWAIAMALGPILQIRKIIEHRSSRTVSVGYFLVLLIGFALWVAYGIAASNFVLIVPNTLAAVVCTATILVALRYRQRPRSGLPGDLDRDHGPLHGPPGSGWFAGGKPRVPGSVPFGGNGLVCLFHTREKYCHNGGIAFAHDHGGRLGWGPRWR